MRRRDAAALVLATVTALAGLTAWMLGDVDLGLRELALHGAQELVAWAEERHHRHVGRDDDRVLGDVGMGRPGGPAFVLYAPALPLSTIISVIPSSQYSAMSDPFGLPER